MTRPGGRIPLFGWLAQVVSTDPESRRISAKYYGTDRGKDNIVVMNGFGDYSFPKVGDQVILLELNQQTYCLGKIEGGYVDKINGDVKDPVTEVNPIAKKVEEGEIFLSNLGKRAWLAISNSGNFSLINGLTEGFEYLARSRIARIAGMAISVIGNSLNMNFGSVVRDIPNVGETVIAGDSPTIPAIEGLIDLISNSIRLARFHIGHVKNTLGADEFSSWGSRLRAVLEVCGSTGTPIGVIKVDELGNIEVSSTSQTIMLDGKAVAGVLLGGLAASSSAVLGEALINWLNTHTHSTGTGPSGIPITLADSGTLLSQKVKVSS